MTFLTRVWANKKIYVLGDGEMTIVGSESFSDLLDLTWTDICEVGEDDLFMESE